MSVKFAIPAVTSLALVSGQAMAAPIERAAPPADSESELSGSPILIGALVVALIVAAILIFDDEDSVSA